MLTNNTAPPKKDNSIFHLEPFDPAHPQLMHLVSNRVGEKKDEIVKEDSL